MHDEVNAVINATQQSNLADQCGGEAGPSKLLSVLELTDTSIHAIYDVLNGVRSVFECRNFNPIYTTLVYDGKLCIDDPTHFFHQKLKEPNFFFFFLPMHVAAVCISGVGGLSWVFFTSLSMAIFSMVMITLRVAIYQY